MAVVWCPAKLWRRVMGMGVGAVGSGGFVLLP